MAFTGFYEKTKVPTEKELEEGRAVRLEIKAAKDVRSAVKLAAVKMAN